jgi:hypothetical protein
VEDQHTGKSLQGLLAGLGLTYLEASKLRTTSDRRIEDALAYTIVRIGDHEEYIKSPDLYVFETCQRTIWEFEHYRWDEWASSLADKKDAKEKTLDKDDHFIENIGRILVQDPVFYPAPKSNEGFNITPNYDPYA